MILVIQFWVGVIQVVIALIATIYEGIAFKSIHKSLAYYWALVLIYFLIFALLDRFLPSAEFTMVWFFSAWAIAVYWFINFASWFIEKDKNEE